MQRRVLLGVLPALLLAEEDHRGLLEQWREAVLQQDVKKLEAMMHEGVWFSHSNGRLETRKEFLEGLVTGAARYELIEIGPQTVDVKSDTAWMRGPMTVRVKRPTGTNTYSLNVLQFG